MSGVLQGFVLGPTLFMIYMNDLPDLLQGDALLFAGDVKLMYAWANFDDLQQAWDWASALDLHVNVVDAQEVQFH